MVGPIICVWFKRLCFCVNGFWRDRTQICTSYRQCHSAHRNITDKCGDRNYLSEKNQTVIKAFTATGFFGQEQKSKTVKTWPIHFLIFSKFVCGPTIFIEWEIGCGKSFNSRWCVKRKLKLNFSVKTSVTTCSWGVTAARISLSLVLVNVGICFSVFYETESLWDFCVRK